jgi:alkylhydroperoxidase/carboxymuconolactone decarboxylase family protein YurZ
MDDDARVARGEKIRRRLMGDEHVDRSLGAPTPTRQLFERYVTGAAWSDVWGRDGLDQHTRSLLTIALLCAGGHEKQLELHVRAAADSGIAAEQVAEALLHVAIYAGFPASSLGFACIDRIYYEVD